jgi:catechol 2,3-dioxygenase-like lactoylglutathione lyase family enzyme
MLANADVMAFVATADLRRARRFYEGVLGLPVIEDDGLALAFEAHDTMLRVTAVRELTPSPYTVLGWSVPDIAAAVGELEARGVAFARYPGFEQDAQGIWTAPTGARVAWFNDPDGNTLQLTELPGLSRS